MDLHLARKSALVTGSTAGIGLAIAISLAREGTRVFVNGRSEARVAAACEKVIAAVPSAAVSGLAIDLSIADGVAELEKKLPEVNILVNNLGIFEAKPFEKIPDADWMKMFETNVMSGVRLSRLYLPKMVSRGWGRIVFISSESGVQIPGEMIHYGMTKTAQLAVSRGLAELTAGTGVTVNSVLPGPTMSEGVEEFVTGLARQQNKSRADVERDFFIHMRPTSLLKRFATADEVANMVTYVCSPQASATNGAALRADGGVVRSIV
ncbi:MAG TPA: SDR family oxidoreductase [Tepidisphaeraceae bacterium]|jgi:NAD(P)-dependent dehydrogenase (short-subunit alcohol dehydrogenase family)|nr:SDR family oxidoreductase [Tepidisphaeraceae bacterium]